MTRNGIEPRTRHLKVVMEDGEEMKYGPGNFAESESRHDTWIVGDEPCVSIDWQG